MNKLPNIKHMRVFLEAVRFGSISEAAHRCHLSQPAATQALARLEEEVGATLVNRDRRNFGATECGGLFQRRVITALAHLRTGARYLRSASAKPTRRTGELENLMTAAQLRTLIAVANTGSFTLAARQLGLSQPTIHRSARGLEELAKTTLFHARSSGVALTSVASAFAQEVKLAQAEIRQGIEEIMHILGSGEGSFVLGSLPLARTMIVPKAVNAMVKENTPIQIRVVDGRYMELLRSLREGDLDCMIGALRFPPPSDDIVQEVLFQDGLVIVAHPSHPLAGRRNIPLEDTLSYPWIAPPKETPAGQYLFETLGIERREKTPVRVVSSSMAVLRGVLTEGPYISVVSRHQVSIEERQGLITPLDVSLKGQFRDIGLTYRKGWRPTSSQAKFIEFLQEFSKNVGNR